jgi:hypothetical protein
VTDVAIAPQAEAFVKRLRRRVLLRLEAREDGPGDREDPEEADDPGQHPDSGDHGMAFADG